MSVHAPLPVASPASTRHSRDSRRPFATVLFLAACCLVASASALVGTTMTASNKQAAQHQDIPMSKGTIVTCTLEGDASAPEAELVSSTEEESPTWTRSGRQAIATVIPRTDGTWRLLWYPADNKNVDLSIDTESTSADRLISHVSLSGDPDGIVTVTFGIADDGKTSWQVIARPSDESDDILLQNGKEDKASDVSVDIDAGDALDKRRSWTILVSAKHKKTTQTVVAGVIE